MDALGHVFRTGGPFFLVNTVFLAVILAIIVERALYFLGRGHVNARAFLEEIRTLLRDSDLDGAKKLCDMTEAPVARVAKAGLGRMHRGEAAVAQAMEEAMTDVTPEIKTRISALWSMANIVTLTGLLGTVTGLIRTFAGIGKVDPSESKDLLSAGISEAMYNTAYGLGLALVCMVAHLLLSTASKRAVADLESFSLKLENMLGGEEPPSATP